MGDSVHRRADELLAHHRDRLAEMAAAVGAGAWTAYLVARTLPWTRRRTLDDRPPYHRMLAVNDTALHLDLLAEQGRVATHRMGGVRDVDGGLIGGLNACGNMAASPFGPGYPGAGTTLAAAMRYGYLSGRSLAAG